MTISAPTVVPKGIRSSQLPDIPGRRYKHLFIARKNKAAEALLRQLKEDGQMFKTQIVDKKSWYVPLLAPKNKSVTWFIFTVAFVFISAFGILTYLAFLARNPEFRQNFSEALEILKG